MPVLQLFRDPKVFPTGRESELIAKMVPEIKEYCKGATISWSVADLGQGVCVFTNLHIRMDWPFHKYGINTYNLAQKIAYFVGQFANTAMPVINFIEVHLGSGRDSSFFSLSRQPKDPENPGDKKEWLFPIPDNFNA